MTGIDRPHLTRIAREQFAFLESRGARSYVHDKSTETTLEYRWRAINIEVELDWRERIVFSLVCRATQSRKTPGYYTHQERRVRIHLGEALSIAVPEHDIQVEKLRKAMAKSGPQAMGEQIAGQARALEAHLDDLLRRVPDLFPQVSSS